MSHPNGMPAVALKTNKPEMRVMPRNRQEFVGDGHILPPLQGRLTVVKSQGGKPLISNTFTRKKAEEHNPLTPDYFLG